MLFGRAVVGQFENQTGQNQRVTANIPDEFWFELARLEGVHYGRVPL
jgi:hypothetical protein